MEEGSSGGCRVGLAEGSLLQEGRAQSCVPLAPGPPRIRRGPHTEPALVRSLLCFFPSSDPGTLPQPKSV